MARDQHDHGSGSTQFNEEEWLRQQLGDAHQSFGSGSSGKRKRGRSSMGQILLIAVLVLACGAGYLFMQQSGKKNTNDSDDLGQGVVNASGLRGHMVTRWLNGKAQYQLKIEPIDPTANAGFAAVMGNSSGPVVINVRVLDSSGFALCGKGILVHFDPARAGAAHSNAPLPKDKAAAEQAALAKEAEIKRAQADQLARERGKDVFQNIAGKDGKIEALWAQGTLPCSPDQYNRFDYWDMTTNFPTLPEQQALLKPKAAPPKKTPAEERAEALRKAAAMKPASMFYIEGDDRLTGYEASRTLLTASPGRSFYIDRKPDQALVAEWAADTALIHYKCDQHGICALRHAGNGVTVMGRVNQ